MNRCLNSFLTPPNYINVKNDTQSFLQDWLAHFKSCLEQMNKKTYYFKHIFTTESLQRNFNKSSDGKQAYLTTYCGLPFQNY